MAVTFECLNVFPALVPIPQLDRHVITRGKNEGLSGVDDNGADVIWVRLE
jgi:hypothetical protein